MTQILTGALLERVRFSHLQDPDPAYDTARMLALKAYPDLLATIDYWRDVCDQLMASLRDESP